MCYCTAAKLMILFCVFLTLTNQKAYDCVNIKFIGPYGIFLVLHKQMFCCKKFLSKCLENSFVSAVLKTLNFLQRLVHQCS